MPIPFLLAGAGILAGVVGVGGHIDAKETNEIAQARRDKAKNMYDKEKDILEKYQEDTKEALLNLGYAKEKTLNQSMKHFLTLYEKIKDVNPKDPSDYKEISRFSIDDTAVLQIKNMSDIYFDSTRKWGCWSSNGCSDCISSKWFFRSCNKWTFVSRNISIYG